MSSGFIPTAEVDAAMRAWRKAKINKNHFRAIARNAMRNLSDAEREKYLEHLKDYDLLAKLFDAGFKDIDVTAFLEIISSTKNFQRPLSATLTSSRNIHLCATPDDAHDGRFFNIYIAGSSENHGVKESNIRTPRIIRLNSAAKNEDAEYDIVINSNGVVKRVQASDELTQMLRIVLFPTVYAGMVDGKVFDQVAENIIYLGATTPVIAAIENLGQTHFDE
jgi:hypothetical protein